MDPTLFGPVAVGVFSVLAPVIVILWRQHLKDVEQRDTDKNARLAAIVEDRNYWRAAYFRQLGTSEKQVVLAEKQVVLGERLVETIAPSGTPPAGA